jgi:hypothetical protein
MFLLDVLGIALCMPFTLVPSPPFEVLFAFLLTPCDSFGFSQWPEPKMHQYRFVGAQQRRFKGPDRPFEKVVILECRTYTSETIVPVSSSQLHCQSSPGLMLVVGSALHGAAVMAEEPDLVSPVAQASVVEWV